MTKSDAANPEAANPAEHKPDRGLVRIDGEECKGCGLCIEACPPKVLQLGDPLNRYGYRNAFYTGSGCTGCGICFPACPEPGAITVWRLAASAPIRTVPQSQGAGPCASN